MQHRVYIDDWSLLEKICLASAVKRLGENWTPICKFIQPLFQEERPWDWFTAETCEAQYKQLYNENVKPSISNEIPIQQIFQSLKSKSKIEGQPREEQKNKYLTLKKIVEMVAKGEITEDELDEYLEKTLQMKKDREENYRKVQELLKNRNAAKAECEKNDTTKSPNKADGKTDASSPVMTSPLLSSLLNNPPAVQYRPTLSTSSFIQTKVTQSQSSSTSRPTTSFSNSCSTARRLSFPDIVGSPTPESRSLPSKDSPTPIETTTVPETSQKNDAQNLENLVLISPNEASYLSEVDIPPETLLEVIDNLKEGTISLDKIIRDLEGGGDDNIIINKDDLNAVVIDETYVSAAEDVKTSEFVEEPQHCEEVVSTDNDLVDHVIPETVSMPIEETIVQSDNYVLKNEQLEVNEEQSTVTIIASNSVSSISPTFVNTECMSSTTATSTPNSELSNNFVSVEGTEATAEVTAANITIESELAEKNVTENIGDEPESFNFIKEQQQQPYTGGAEAKTSYIQEVDASNAEDTRLSGDSYVTCESASEVEETVETIVEEREPQTFSQIVNEEVAESKSFDEGRKDEKQAEVKERSIEPAVESIKDLKFDEPATGVVAAVELKTLPSPTDVVENNEVVVQVEEVVEQIEDVKKPNDIFDYPSPSSNNVAEEVIEKVVSKPEGTPNKRRSSASLRRSEIRTLVEEEKRQLESITEEMTKTASKAEPLPQQHQQPSDKYAVAVDSEKTSEKELVVAEIVNDVGIEVAKSSASQQQNRSTIRRQSRKRKSVSEGDETQGKDTENLPDTSEKVRSEDEREPPVDGNANKELNITIKDLRDDMDLSLEAELLKPKEEPLEKESAVDITQPSEKSENASRSSEFRRHAKPRRSSARTRSPAVKLDLTSSSSPGSSDDSELARTRRKSILLAYSRLMSHKYSNAFQKPITSKQVPGYENIIYNPMDLHTIKRKIDNRQISTVAEFQRDVLLMLNNAKMFNQVNSQVYNMAVEVEKDTLDHLEVTVQALGEGILRRAEKTNAEKIRKRQSLENSKKDSKLAKRPKSITKDDVIPMKKIKTEDNEDGEIHP